MNGEHELGRPVSGVKDNPSKPNKAVSAAAIPAAIAVLTVLSNEMGADLWPPWVILLITAAIAGLTTYYVKNPKVRA